MLHSISDFINIWQFECHNTEKIFKNLTDDSLNKALVPNGRTLGQLAWHILETPKEMLHKTGLEVEGPVFQNPPPPTTVKEILEMHKNITHSVEHQVQSHWNNKTLHVVDNMYGEEWTRSKTLLAIIFHLIHHRGQMTVLMRLAGLKVPGIYGPACEEWSAMGMEPPKL